jgi:hypothetical protein
VAGKIGFAITASKVSQFSLIKERNLSWAIDNGLTHNKRMRRTDLESGGALRVRQLTAPRRGQPLTWIIPHELMENYLTIWYI